jgi:ADP-ribose pyrophosphatase YjhB (NUDIX family)
MPETIVCVGTVVRRGDEILLARQSKGHPLEGQWTIPWGRLNNGESPMTAAVRETLEETGVVADVEGFLGIQELPSPWSGWIGLIYLCQHVSGHPEPQDREMDAARYFTEAELATIAEPVEPLSGWLAQRVFFGNYTVIAMSETNPLGSRGSFLCGVA